MLFEIYDDIYAVGDLPAIYFKKFNALIIADIHLGFEEDMASKGIFLPRVQLRKSIEIIDKAQNMTRAAQLIIAGDVKHHFEKLGRREVRDLREFFEYVSRRFEKIIIVRGNHDTFMYSFSRKLGIELYDKLWLNNVLLVHGHRELDKSDSFDIVIMGHEHPSISLKDPVTGYGIKIQCHLIVPLRRGGKALVLPAMGVYQSGTPISISREAYLSPIIRDEGILEEAKPYAIIEGEGIYELPKLSSITDLLKII